MDTATDYLEDDSIHYLEDDSIDYIEEASTDYIEYDSDDGLTDPDLLSEEDRKMYDNLWDSTLLGAAFWRDQKKNKRFYSRLWKGTLMGAEFWRERERTNPYDSTYHDPMAYSFYPVALQKHILAGGSMDRETLRAVIAGSTDNGPYDPDNEVNMALNEPLYQERRKSMSDLRPLKPGPLASGSKKHFWNFNRKAAEDYDVSEKRRPRFVKSFIRSALRFSGILNRKIEEIEEVQEGDCKFDFGFDPHPGSEENPLLYFRGGASWKYIERNLDVLCLDVFWPITKKTRRYHDMIKISELRPLCTFRHLRVLKITGMMQSYQSVIWQVVWLNPDLEELELEMALEPTIRRDFKGDWPSIGPGWKIGEQKKEGLQVYYGAGDGTIRSSIGTGEYLDKGLIESGGVLAAQVGPTKSRLSLVVVKLAGFIVDGDPFSLFCEPRRLRRIQFKHNCIDSGFYLDGWMKGTVEVIFPKKAVSNIAQTARVVNLAKELKVIELSKGKKISEAPYRPPGGFHKGCHHHHDGKKPAGTCSHQKNKENEHCCCGKKANDKGMETGHHGMTTGGEEPDNSTDKKGSEHKSTGQSSMATPAPRPKGAPRHGRNAILPRMMGKLGHKGKSSTEKE
ncbi:hypothetical protein ANI_1_1406104 [Paecilomyces variotii No. 5]|uniref:Uncharacterized protein n=1 Tax=Byssochlamys spectabilis (strain No. 5 / NBRC 109023) TaxID=1356009 RepID=V5I128_BYSSN|nr:hypothetical protein ANI_1_1406104 [Paecilomyces variotii No. 5]